YLSESLRHEGQGDAVSQPCCSGIKCENDDFTYQCITCWDRRLFCRLCIVMVHGCSPTHIVQHWNGEYFDRILLRKLGLSYQVGHPLGDICIHPCPAFDHRFTIIDTNGVHDINLNFCNCCHECPLATQLQCMWLFPGTVMEPHTAVTMAALEQFQMLTFMGKLSAYEYYHSLAQLLDNTGTNTPLVCRVPLPYCVLIYLCQDNYEAFICIVHK
ncbi:hypothetical protein EDD18DRAFT_1078111, partial [Armillaria luteobubalina]